MKIQQLIDEQMHRFEYLYLIESKDKRKFADLANDNSYISIFNYAKSIKSFVSKDYTRQLIKAVGEELIGEDEKPLFSERYKCKDSEEKTLRKRGRNELREIQLLKVKEILQNIT